MQILHQTGVSYRTKLLTIEAAGRFAKCLGANSRFEGVTIETSTRAKSEKRYFVQFAPANTERQADLLQSQQDARAERAATQGFTFCLDKDGGRPFFWCWSHSSGEVYEVTEHSCNCPDSQFRSGPAGIKCKHQIALAAEIAHGGDAIRTW